MAYVSSLTTTDNITYDIKAKAIDCVASPSTLGGIKVGDGLGITSGGTLYTTGGDSVFTAWYGSTPYYDIVQAWNDGQVIVVRHDEYGSFVIGSVIDLPYEEVQLLMLRRDQTRDVFVASIFVITAEDDRWEWFETELAKATELNGKQDTLVSGTNIKTVNNQSLLGSGNIDIQGGGGDVFVATFGTTTHADVLQAWQGNKVIVVDHPTMGAFVATSAVYYGTGTGTLQLWALSKDPDTDTVLSCCFSIDRDTDEWQLFTGEMVDILDLRTGLATKQDKLVSGTNIKTIDGASILGAGNIDTGDAFVATYGVTSYADLTAAIAADKVILLSMTANQNLFCMTYSTYNNGGNAVMYAIFNYTGHPTLMTVTLTPEGNWTIAHERLQNQLVSGTNIKTVNNQSLLGAGNIDIQGGGDSFVAVPYTTPYADLREAVDAGKKIWVQTTGILEVATQVLKEGSSIMIRVAPSVGQTTAKSTVYDVRPDSPTWVKLTGDFKQYVDGQLATKADIADIPGQAADSTLGTVKTNPDESITLNADGQLQVGGRMGQFPTSTGIYAPNNRAPRAVGDYSFLMTDALGMDLAANRSMAIVSGYGMTCQSAAAGSTEYRVTNNYANRIICKMAEGGYASLSESVSTQQQIVKITSVTINGATFNPDSSADSSTPIIIKTASTLNPSAATTSIRLFGKMGSYATAHFGNGVTSDSGGRCLLVGGGIRKSGSSNDNLLVGNGIFSSGNGVAAFGRYHIARKNRGLLAGTGHDTTNAPSEGASAVGQYSFMDANTLFAVGNGTSHTNRSNALEVRTDGIVIKSPDGTRYKIAVDNSGNLSTTSV